MLRLRILTVYGLAAPFSAVKAQLESISVPSVPYNPQASLDTYLKPLIFQTGLSRVGREDPESPGVYLAHFTNIFLTKVANDVTDSFIRSKWEGPWVPHRIHLFALGAGKARLLGHREFSQGAVVSQNPYASPDTGPAWEGVWLQHKGSVMDYE